MRLMTLSDIQSQAVIMFQHALIRSFFILFWLVAICLSVKSEPLYRESEISYVTGRLISSNAGLPDNNIRSIAVDDDGFVWLSSLYSIYRYDGYRYLTVKLPEKNNGMDFSRYRIERLANIGNYQLLVRWTNGVSKILNTHNLEFEDPNHDTVGTAQISPGKNRFVDNRGNVIRFDELTGEISIPVSVGHDSLRLKVVTDDMIRQHNDYKITAVMSSDSIIWVSTNGNGLFVHDPLANKTLHLTGNQFPSLMASDFITSMTAGTDGAVWLAFNRSGIARLKMNRDSIRTVSMEELSGPQNNAREIKLLKKLHNGLILVANDAGNVGVIDFPNNKVIEVKEFPSGLEYLDADISPWGTPWIATRNNGLMIDNRWYKMNNGDDEAIGGNRVDAVKVDASGRIWVGGSGFLDCVVATGGASDSFSFRHFMSYDKRSNVRQLLLDKYGNMWGATDNGIIVWNPDSLLNDNAVSSGNMLFLPVSGGVRINVLTEDTTGRIWIGSEKAGLYYIDNSSALLNQQPIVPEAAEWISPTADIQLLSCDAEGNLWIGTDEALFMYDHSSIYPAKLHFENNTEKNVYQRGCVAEIADGLMAFGTGDGVVVLSSDDVIKRNIPVNIFISDVLSGNNSLLSKISISDKNDSYSLSLEENEGSITICFTDLSFDPSARFSYKMEGIDSSWIMTEGVPMVSYSNLSPGRHIFMVRAISPAGHFTEKKVEITVAHSSGVTKVVAFATIALLVLMSFMFFRKKQQRTKNDNTCLPQVNNRLPELITDNRDRDFITTLNTYIDEHMAESDLGVDRLAMSMNYGRTRFYNKVNRLLGCSPKEYLRKRRIEKAAEMLKEEHMTIAEVAYKVGFGTPQYLTTVFKQLYGISPSQYRKNGTNSDKK